MRVYHIINYQIKKVLYEILDFFNTISPGKQQIYVILYVIRNCVGGWDKTRAAPSRLPNLMSRKNVRFISR